MTKIIKLKKKIINQTSDLIQRQINIITMAKCVFYVGWFHNFFKVFKSKLLTTDTIIVCYGKANSLIKTFRNER